MPRPATADRYRRMWRPTSDHPSSYSRRCVLLNALRELLHPETARLVRGGSIDSSVSVGGGGGGDGVDGDGDGGNGGNGGGGGGGGMGGVEMDLNAPIRPAAKAQHLAIARRHGANSKVCTCTCTMHVHRLPSAARHAPIRHQGRPFDARGRACVHIPRANIARVEERGTPRLAGARRGRRHPSLAGVPPSHSALPPLLGRCSTRTATRRRSSRQSTRRLRLGSSTVLARASRSTWCWCSTSSGAFCWCAAAAAPPAI